MCGIAGTLGEREVASTQAMMDVLYHRGPDSSGVHSEPFLHIGMRRLSIIDLSSGDQPIYNEDRDKAIVFNGEIYNYQELRSRLLRLGHHFETHSDTEVILHLFEEYGRDCVEHLRGMFAFAIACRGGLFIARDRLGIKPLYYTIFREGEVFAFASEIKALLSVEQVQPSLDAMSLADVSVLGFPVGHRTIFKDIYQLEPGRTAFVRRREDGQINLDVHKYYDLRFGDHEDITFDEAKSCLSDLLTEAVDCHMLADVEVGLTVSGGLDSGVLAAIVNELKKDKLRTFTIGSSEHHPDVQCAREVCGKVDCQHEVSIPGLDEFLAGIPGCIAAQERPSRLLGMPFFLLCQKIARSVKVCLNGEGADEVFGGYPEYVNSSHLPAFYKRNLQRAQRLGMSVSDEASSLIESISGSSSFSDYARRIFLCNQKDKLVHHHLEVTDKFGMAFGLEIRVPYMDHRLVEFVNGLPVSFKVNRPLGIQKHILKVVAVERYGEMLLNTALRRKLGFPSAGMAYIRRFEEICKELTPAGYRKKHEYGGLFEQTSELVIFDLFSEIFLKRRGELIPDFDLLDFIKEL